MEYIMFFLIAISLLLNIVLYVKNGKISSNATALKIENEERLFTKNEEISNLNTQNAVLLNTLNSKDESIKELKDSIEKIKQEKEKELSGHLLNYNDSIENIKKYYESIFTNIKIELEKSKKEELRALELRLENKYQEQNALLNEQNKNAAKVIFETITKPMKESIEEYKKTLNENQGTFHKSILSMEQAAKDYKKEAQELARVLRGDKKARGNFGELQLKSCLESSGLEEGKDYWLQRQFETQETDNAKPDAVVFLTDGRGVIIDAKFPLPSSTNDAGIELSEEIQGKSLVANLKKRIEELSAKSYRSIKHKDISAVYDYVFLFLPYEGLLSWAIEVDKDIASYAHKKQVILATPSSLYVALYSIYISWNNVKAEKNAQQVLDQAGKLYDKFYGLIADWAKVEKGIKSATEALGKFRIKCVGRGGMVKLLEDLSSNNKIAKTKTIEMEYNNEPYEDALIETRNAQAALEYLSQEVDPNIVDDSEDTPEQNSEQNSE